MANPKVPRHRPQAIFSLAPSTISMIKELSKIEKNRSRAVDNAIKYFYKKRMKI